MDTPESIERFRTHSTYFINASKRYNKVWNDVFESIQANGGITPADLARSHAAVTDIIEAGKLMHEDMSEFAEDTIKTMDILSKEIKELIDG